MSKRNQETALAVAEIQAIMQDMKEKKLMNSMFIGIDGDGVAIVHEIDTDEHGMAKVMAGMSRCVYELLKAVTEEAPDDQEIDGFLKVLRKSLLDWRDADQEGKLHGSD